MTAQAKPQKTVLVIDDNESMRRIIGEWLSVDSGYYTVVSVASLEEARSVLSSGLVPDVAVVDLKLPNGQGLIVPRTIVDETPGQDWPLFCISGYYDDNYGDLAMEISPRVQSYVGKSKLDRTLFMMVLRHCILRSEISRKVTREMKLSPRVVGRPVGKWYVRAVPYALSSMAAAGGTVGAWSTLPHGFRLAGAVVAALAASWLGVWQADRKRKARQGR